MNTHSRRVAAGWLATTVLITPITILAAAPVTASTAAFLWSSAGADRDGMTGMTDDSAAVPMAKPSAMPSSPVEAPMHDMESDTGHADAPDMAGASHDDMAGASHDDVAGASHDDVAGASHDDVAGASHDDVGSPSIAPNAHDSGGHGDETTDMTSEDAGGHDDGRQAVTAPPEGQRKVVLAGFAAVNLLVIAGAGILRRRGHGSRSRQRTTQGPSAAPRRSGTATKDRGDQA